MCTKINQPVNTEINTEVNPNQLVYTRMGKMMNMMMVNQVTKMVKLVSKKRHGGIHTIEAALGVMIILTFVLVIMPGMIQQERPAESARRAVFSSLGALDAEGDLRPLVLADNLTALKAKLEPALPQTLNFTVGIANATSTTILDDLPAGREITVISYLISGYNVTFSPKEVRVYVW